MIIAEFLRSGKMWTGFRIKGHAGFAESGHDIVCASVSSAVQLSVNKFTEIFKIDSETSVRENNIAFNVINSNDISDGIIAGLKLHLEFLSQDFPKTIKINTLEV